MTFIGISDDNLLPTASFAQSRVKSSVTEWSIPPCLNFAILVQFCNACCFVWTSRKGHDHARLQHGKVKRNKASSYMFRRPNFCKWFKFSSDIGRPKLAHVQRNPNWVKPNLENKKYKPGTIFSYLTSYEKFLIFVTHQRFNKEAPPLHADDSKLFDIIKNDLKGWRSIVDSKSHEHKNQRFIEESDGLLTLDELDKIKSSKTYGECRRVIIQAGKGKEPSLTEFLLARDFLLTKFSLDTGTRPGPLNNATILEYRAGKVKDECKVMLVAKHKRAKD
ncbi:hypothetical protein ACROYT_G014670 [Oculina patagonica]